MIDHFFKGECSTFASFSLLNTGFSAFLQPFFPVKGSNLKTSLRALCELWWAFFHIPFLTFYGPSVSAINRGINQRINDDENNHQLQPCSADTWHAKLRKHRYYHRQSHCPALAQGWGVLRTQLGENSRVQVQATHLVWWHPSHFRWCIDSSSTSRVTPSGARQTETCFILPRHSEKISDPGLKRIDLLIDLWHGALWACSCSGTNLHRSQTRQTWTPQGSSASRAAPAAPTLYLSRFHMLSVCRVWHLSAVWSTATKYCECLHELGARARLQHFVTSAHSPLCFNWRDRQQL